MYEECDRRALGHDWDFIPATEKPSFGEPLWRRCTRCHTIRKVSLNRFNGDQLSSYYDYPENWKTRFDTFDGMKPSPAEFRKYLLLKMYLGEIDPADAEEEKTS